MSSSGDWSYAYGDSNEFGEEGGEEGGDDMEDESQASKTKDAVMYLVDANPSMWEKLPGKNETMMGNLLRCIANSIKQKIINNNTDLIGITFFATKSNRNESGFDAVYVLRSLEGADAKLIKDIEALQDEKEFAKRIGSVEERKYEFYKALWACSTEFSAATLKGAAKRMVVFTNTDDPTFGSVDLGEKTKQKIKDLEDLDITFELVPFHRPGKPDFNPKKFYANVVSFDPEEMAQLSSKGVETLEQLEARFRKKEYKKRSLATIPFEIGKGITLKVKIFCMLRTATKDWGKWLDAKTNEVLDTKTQWVCQDTGSILEDHQIKTFYPYGGEKVFIKKEEMGELKKFGEPNLTLMGFKPMEALKDYHNLKPPYFIYPDETTMKGSTVAFHALLKSMADKKKIAICRMVYRKASIPKFVALIPQEEKEVNGELVQYPGMHMIGLPYADDIRQPKFEATPIAEADLIVKAKQIIQSMQAKFDNTTFENPALQKHYAIVQALALDEKIPQDIEDVTLPDYERMAKYASIIQAFAEAAGVGGADIGGGGDDGDDEEGGGGRSRGSSSRAPRGGGGSSSSSSSSGASRKRKAPDSESEEKGGGKRAKKEKVEDAGAVDWKALATSGALKKKTIPELKVYLKAHGLPVSGKKDDLLDRITSHLGV